MGAFRVKRTDLYLLLVLFGLTLAQFVLFLPNNHVVSDIWDYWKFQESGISLFFQPTSRPLVHQIYWLAWSITPHSWAALNALQVSAIVLKSIATYWFVAQVLNRPAALLAGALLLVFPASFGIYSTWTLNINLSLAALIAALASLIWLSRSSRWLAGVLMVAGLAYSLLSYEMGWPMALFGPVVLLMSGPAPARRKALILWYGTVAAAAVAVGLILLSTRGHLNLANTGAHFTRAASMFDLSVETLPASIVSMINAYRVHLIGVFEETTAYLTASKRSPLVLMSTASGLTVGAALLALTFRGVPRIEARKWVGAALLGLALIGLGYAPIAVSVLRDNRFHVMIYSSFGAVIFFAAVLCGLHDRLSARLHAGRAWAVGLAGVSALLMALLTFRSLDLTLAIISNANAQKAFGESIVLQIPDPQPGSAFLVFDPDGRLFTLFEERPDRVGNMLGTVYEDHDLPVFVCRAEGEPADLVSVCELREDGAYVQVSAGEPPLFFPLDQTAVFQAVDTGSGLRAELEHMGAAVAGGSELPRRMSMLQTTPLPSRQ